MSVEQNSVEIVSAGFAAGDARVFALGGSFFELIDCPNPVDVLLVDRHGAQRGQMKSAEASFSLRGTEFQEIQIRSATAQTIRFAYGTGEVGTRRTVGTVSVSNWQGAFTQAQATVTNASAALLAANTARRYLLIQNNDLSGDIFVTLDGTAATTAKGVKIAPGGFYELHGYQPTGQIFAIGSIASNANVVVVGG